MFEYYTKRKVLKRKIVIQMDTAHYEECHEERGKKTGGKLRKKSSGKTKIVEQAWLVSDGNLHGGER
jgi:hypothetical protein